MKEYIYGSSRQNGGFDLISCSSSATPTEKAWVKDNSVYKRVSSQNSPISYALTCCSDISFLSKTHTVPNVAFLSKTQSDVDYTGRSSFQAHHIELSPQETIWLECGPLSVLEQYTFALFREDAPLPNVDQNVANQLLRRNDPNELTYRHCGLWQHLFGNIGILAVSRIADILLSGRSVVVLYGLEASEWIYPLFRELYALIPVAYRWKISFNTYSSNEGAQEQLSGIVKDSPLYEKIRSRLSSISYIDLSNLSLDTLQETQTPYSVCLQTEKVLDIANEYECVLPTSNGNSISELLEGKEVSLREMRKEYEEIENFVKKSIDERSREKDSLLQQIAEAKTEREKYSRDCKHYRDENQKMETTLKNLQDRINALQQREFELTEEKQALETNINMLNSQIQILENKKNDLNSQCESKRNERSQLETTIEEKNNKISELNTSIAEKENKTTNLDTSIKAKEEEIQELHKRKETILLNYQKYFEKYKKSSAEISVFLGKQCATIENEISKQLEDDCKDMKNKIHTFLDKMSTNFTQIAKAIEDYPKEKTIPVPPNPDSQKSH